MADEVEGFDRLIDDGAQAWAAFDRDMRYLAVSSKWLADYRLKSQVIGRSLYEALPEIGESSKAARRRCLAGATETCGGERFVRADGGAHWIAWKVRPLRTKSGAIGGIVIVTETVEAPEEQEAPCEVEKPRGAVAVGTLRASVVLPRAASATASPAPASEDRYKPQRILVEEALPTAFRSVWNTRLDRSMSSDAGPARPDRSGARPSAHVLPLPGAAIAVGARATAYRLIKDKPENGRPELMLNVVLCGSRCVEQRGRVFEGGAGSAVFSTNLDGGLCSYKTGGQYVGVFAPTTSLRQRIPDVESRLMQPIAPDSPALRLIVAYVSGLIKSGEDLDRDAAKAVSDHLVDLCALLLGARGDDRALAEARGLRAAQTAVICEAIGAGAATPGFSARSVAARLNVSPRFVHYLLEETGKGFASRVAARKLELVRERLADPRFDRMSVPELAFACGFADLPAFERQFRALYGDAPAAFRASRR